MNKPIGQKIWGIAEGYIPDWSNGPEPQMLSHETACILNTSDEDAHIKITIYFSDRDRIGSYKITVSAYRTRHIRFNNFEDPEPIPNDTDYTSVIASDVPVIVQNCRLDSRQVDNALFNHDSLFRMNTAEETQSMALLG